MDEVLRPLGGSFVGHAGECPYADAMYKMALATTFPTRLPYGDAEENCEWAHESGMSCDRQ